MVPELKLISLFFFGDMDKAAKGAVKTGVAGYVARTLWNAITESEDVGNQQEAERQTAVAVSTATTPTDSETVQKMTDKKKEELMETKAPFTNAEKTLKESIIGKKKNWRLIAAFLYK